MVNQARKVTKPQAKLAATAPKKAPVRRAKPPVDPNKPKGSAVMPPTPGKGAQMSVVNASGSAMHTMEPLKALDMLLRMGIIGTNMYASIGERTQDALGVIQLAIAKDPLGSVKVVKEVLGHEYEPGKFRSLALRDSMPHLAYAMLLSNPDVEVRRAAAIIFNQVIHTGEDLLDMLATLWGTHEAEPLAKEKQTSPTHTKREGNLRGMGSIVQRCFRNWLAQPIGFVAYQLTKYNNRHSFAVPDLIKLVRPKPISAEHSLLFQWLLARASKECPPEKLAALEAEVKSKISGMPAAAIAIRETNLLVKALSDEAKADAIKVKAIKTSRAVREIVPTEWYDKAVWTALLDDMPTTALLRNLGQMSKQGVFGTQQYPDKGAIKVAYDKLVNRDIITHSRVHPLRVLIAQRSYGMGHSQAANAARKSDYAWPVFPKLLEAVEVAFELSFGNVKSTAKTVLFAHDISRSMSFEGSAAVSWDASRALGIPVDQLYATEIENQRKYGRQYGLGMITASELVGVIAMILMRKSANMIHTVFSIKDPARDMALTRWNLPENNLLLRSPLTPASSLADFDALSKTNVFGATNLSLPIDYCLQNNLYPDAIVIGTDYEMNCGRQPMEAMNELRKAAKKPIKFIVAATSLPRLPGSIVDQFDANCLDVAGASADVATVIQEFIQS